MKTKNKGKIIAILVVFLPVITFAQDIYGTWLIQEQYSNDVLIIDKPYMKYEFTYDGIWNVEAKQRYNTGDFNYLQQGGTYKIEGDNLILIHPDPENDLDYNYYKFKIEGDILTIWLNDKFGRVKMIFKRVRRNDT